MASLRIGVDQLSAVRSAATNLPMPTSTPPNAPLTDEPVANGYAAPAEASQHHGVGHRARLRSRLLTNGADALHDHEIVEYLFAVAIPRKDTKPLAKQLIAEFGGFGGLLSADSESIGRIGGMSESAVASLKIVQAACLRLLKSEFEARPVLNSWQGLLDYLRADMAHQGTERVRVLHLNTKNVLIRDDLVSQGSIDSSAIHVREVIRRALDFGSASLIIVHNHPSGDPKPSRQDIAITRELIEAGRSLGITVRDHIVIAGNGHASMKALGLI